MNPKTNISNELYNYSIQFGTKEHITLRNLREFTASLPNNNMQISIDQGQLMGLLAKITNCQYLEIGVFTGYSSLCIALAMQKIGRVFALDNNEEYVNIAKQYWQEACVMDQITPLIGDALSTLEYLVNQNHKNTFDIAFIDADKNNYIQYYELCLQLIKPEGIILVDNVLMQGKVIEQNPPAYAKAIHQFNLHIYNDDRVSFCMLPFSDGLSIISKKI